MFVYQIFIIFTYHIDALYFCNLLEELELALLVIIIINVTNYYY